MRISAKDWAMYTARLSRLGKTAESMMREYIAEHGEEEIERLWDFAFGLVTKYGEGAASLACEMYDALAEAQGAKVPPASPAYTARLWETEVAMKGTTDAEKPAAVSRLVKRSAADTTLKNAIRDHAEFAWIPSGDSCAFCLTLASRGWQPASKNSLKNGHAEHIHANCDCQYAIRFDKTSTVQGYDPEKYRAMYYSAEGSTPQEKINSMRREMAAEKKTLHENREDGKIISGAISGALDPSSERAKDHADRYYAAVRKMTTDCERIATNTGFELGDIESIKEFVFNAKHDLGGDIEELFTPSYEIAESWQRLIEGKNIQKHDITLLQHEMMEQELMRQGMSQETAHLITSRKYNYGKEAREYYDQIAQHKKKQ